MRYNWGRKLKSLLDRHFECGFQSRSVSFHDTGVGKNLNLTLSLWDSFFRMNWSIYILFCCIKVEKINLRNRLSIHLEINQA